MTFTIDMLPANEGDALWIEYGSDPVRRILIDCGRKTAYRAVADRLDRTDDARFELFVLSHVDADHIAGAVPLLQDARFGPDKVGDIWFNGWRHLNGQHKDAEEGEVRILGARQGEFFAAVLRDREYPWNEAFDGHPVILNDTGDLPSFTMEGGMVLTLLGPTKDKLDDMRDRWRDDLEGMDDDEEFDPGDWEAALRLLEDDRAHAADIPVLGGAPKGQLSVDEVFDLAEEPFDPDHSEPNGSSISFLAEFGGKSVLFAADAHSPQLARSIRRLMEQRGQGGKLKIDAFKMSHHGSARNNSHELLKMFDCRRFLVSTNGSRHHHPDPAAIARVVTLNSEPVELHFNYRSDESALWDDNALKDAHGFETFYPTGVNGLRVQI